jgi:hypothetical protein
MSSASLLCLTNNSLTVKLKNENVKERIVTIIIGALLLSRVTNVTNLAARPDSVRSRPGLCAHTDKYLAPASSIASLVNGVPS